MIPGFELIKDVKVRVNHAEDWFSYLLSFYSRFYTYVSVEKVIENIKVASNSKIVLQLNFHIDEQYIHIERRVFSFIDVLGQLGGVMGIFIPLGSYFVSIFSDKIFWSTLLSVFYKVEINRNDKITKIHPIESNRSTF